MGLLAEIIELDMSYKAKYELCDEHGLSKSTGSGPARNFIWDHAVKSGAAWHWIMDDNISSFMRLHRNEKHKVQSGVFFAAMEEFALRYTNVAMAGPTYETFCPRYYHFPPFIPNTRIYSCNLIRCDVPFRWRGRYNEDTILSLDMLKAGWCTIEFCAFLQRKMATQSLPGGNTSEVYDGGKAGPSGTTYTNPLGTLPKSKMLARLHPDCAKVTWKFGRAHHQVSSARFKRQKLIRRPDLVLPSQPDEMGMRLVQRGSTTHGEAGS
jgi:hypothetical protein